MSLLKSEQCISVVIRLQEHPPGIGLANCYICIVWPKIALLVDADDISEKPYGTYHHQKRPPLDLAKMKSRKVEDSET